MRKREKPRWEGPYMNFQELVAYTRTSRPVLLAAIKSVDGHGDLPHLEARMVGPRYVFSKPIVDAWLDSLPEA